MKIRVLNSVFKEKVKSLSGFTKPSGMGLYATISANDDENVSIKVEHPDAICEVSMVATIEELGEVTISYKEMQNIINNTSDIKILTLEASDDVLCVSSDEDGIVFEFKTRFAQLNITHTNWKTSVSFPFAGFIISEMLRISSPFVSTDTSRPYLNGIRMENVNGGLVFKSTDGKRACILMPKRSDEETPIPYFDPITIPNFFAKEIFNKFKELKDPIVIKVGEKCLGIETEKTIMYTTLLEKSFPNIDTIIPEEFISKFSVSTSDFLKAVRRASLCCDSSNKIELDIEANSLTLKAQGEEKDMSITLGCQYNGKRTKLYFNYKYIQDLLSVYNGEIVVFHISDNRKPLLIEDNMATYVIMAITPK